MALPDAGVARADDRGGVERDSAQYHRRAGAGSAQGIARAGREKLVMTGIAKQQRPYGAVNASTSSIVLGIAAVSTSWPSAVTRTSSSIRIPTPRISSGTLSSSGEM